MIETITGHRFADATATGDRIVALFGMEGCGPCKIMEARLGEIDVAGVRFVKISANEDQQPFLDHNVRTAPTLLAFEGGEEVGIPAERLIGAHSMTNTINWIDAQFGE